MSVSRLDHVTPIGVEQMGALADSLADPDVLRLENLDTNLPIPAEALERTRNAVGDDDANSYLPFLGRNSLRESATRLVNRQSGARYEWTTDCVISAGGLSGILNVLLATLEEGAEVLLTDPTYVGLLNRVRLAGGVPRLLPLRPGPGGWRLEADALQAIDGSRVAVVLMMSPSMPSGAVLTAAEWQRIADFCKAADCLLVYDAAMERILFGERPVLHPAAIDGMQERVITVGSASKEYRMIGWRVGWIVGPSPIMADVARVSIANVVCQTGIAMDAVAAAIDSQDDGIAATNATLERRADLILRELADYDVIPPHGGWSLLVDVSALGLSAAEASARLLEHGKVAATAMDNWGGERCASLLRLVYSNETCERLEGLGARFDAALG